MRFFTPNLAHTSNSEGHDTATRTRATFENTKDSIKTFWASIYQLDALLFACAILIVSLPQLILTPPFQVPDAFAHYLKAQALAEGHLLPSTLRHAAGNTMPSSLTAFANLFSALPFHPAAHITSHSIERASSLSLASPPIFTAYTATSFDPPFLYLPTAVGLFAGSLLRLTLLQSYYLAEATMLVTAILLLAFAFSITPRTGRPFMAAVALLPMAASLYPSVSRDALILPLAILAVAARVRWADAILERRLGKPEYWVTALALIPIAMTKPPYWPLIPLLYIPYERLGKRPSHLLRPLLAPSIASLAIIVSWYLAVYRRLALTFINTANISVSRQIVWLLSHPLAGLRVISQTITFAKDFYYESAIGILGWLDTPLPHWVYPLLGILLLLCATPLLASLSSASRTWSPLLIATLTGQLIFLGVEFALYATWTPVGAPVVQGVQGRYLLPILPLLGLLASNGEFHRRLQVPLRRIAISAVALEVAISLAVVPATLLSRFWA